MTALLAAGGGLPLALKIPHVVEQIGSIAGFAAVAGLAILSALYISAARDLRRLREWAGRAPERAADGVPGRVPQPPATAAGTAAAGPRVVQRVPQPQPAAPAGAANGSPPEAATDDEKKEGEPAEAATAEGDDAAKDAAATAAAADADGDKDKGEGTEAEEQSKEEVRAPGMPAPASAAAAAAGAKAASATAPTGSPAAPPAPGAAAAAPSAPAQGSAPAAPGQAAAPGGAPKPAPGRPGSVLPPRAPAPPVRRIPSAAPGARPQTGLIREPEPASAKRKRNPVYVALAVIGVLILGAGAAIGVPRLVEGDTDGGGQKTASKTTSTTAKAPPATASKINVAVLNGTSVPGLAADIGDRVDAAGFTKGTVDNAVGPQRANSVIKYSRGHQSDARLVAKKLKIGTIEPMDATSQGIAGDATVVVVVGSDLTR